MIVDVTLTSFIFSFDKTKFSLKLIYVKNNFCKRYYPNLKSLLPNKINHATMTGMNFESTICRRTYEHYSIDSATTTMPRFQLLYDNQI